eukprot:gnl/Carplike_NY0171/2546_a3419_457.p1 GENE.gnl/Carplike_NY0171/2546_a3419_457~~gnl/Carplike_NY0171/2546_a3419_457.p1  ORF type:complete len:940 (-),score=370.43 gnl/Carplike_NY0171/2546_a3419_457:54-2540(-)
MAEIRSFFIAQKQKALEEEKRKKAALSGGFGGLTKQDVETDDNGKGGKTSDAFSTAPGARVKRREGVFGEVNEIEPINVSDHLTELTVIEPELCDGGKIDHTVAMDEEWKTSASVAALSPAAKAAKAANDALMARLLDDNILYDPLNGRILPASHVLDPFCVTPPTFVHKSRGPDGLRSFVEQYEREEEERALSEAATARNRANIHTPSKHQITAKYGRLPRSFAGTSTDLLANYLTNDEEPTPLPTSIAKYTPDNSLMLHSPAMSPFLSMPSLLPHHVRSQALAIQTQRRELFRRILGSLLLFNSQHRNLCKVRTSVVRDLKHGQVRASVLIKEIELLKSAEQKDDLLKQEWRKRREEKVTAIFGLVNIARKVEESKKKSHLLEDKAAALNKEFNDIIQTDGLDKVVKELLTKVYKKKKGRGEEDEGEEDDMEWDFDDDDDEDEDEDCPEDCPEEIWDRVQAMVLEKESLEEQIQEIQRVLDGSKRDVLSLQRCVTTADNMLEECKKEIAAQTLRKRKMLNSIDCVLCVKPSQLKHVSLNKWKEQLIDEENAQADAHEDQEKKSARDAMKSARDERKKLKSSRKKKEQEAERSPAHEEEEEDTICPNDFSHAIVFSKSSLAHLKQTAQDHVAAKRAILVSRKKMREGTAQLAREHAQLAENLKHEQKRLLDVQNLKFGRPVDLTLLDAAAVNPDAEKYMVERMDSDKVHSETMQDLVLKRKEVDADYQQALKENTDAVKYLSHLEEQKLRLGQKLESYVQSTLSTAGPDRETGAHREELIELDKMQKMSRELRDECDTLRATVMLLRCKSGSIREAGEDEFVPEGPM